MARWTPLAGERGVRRTSSDGSSMTEATTVACRPKAARATAIVVLLVAGVGTGGTGPSPAETRLRSITVGEWRLSWSPLREGQSVTRPAVAVHVRSGRRLRLPSNWLVSVVGPVVSYVGHDEDTSSTWLSAVALQPGTPPAHIATLFDAADVRTALLKARRVSERLGGASAPASLEELVEVVDASDTRHWNHLLTSFAVVRLEGQSAIVTFGIGGNRGSYEEFDLRIPIPARSRAWFLVASRSGALSLAPTWGPVTEEPCCLEPGK